MKTLDIPVEHMRDGLFMFVVKEVSVFGDKVTRNDQYEKFQIWLGHRVICIADIQFNACIVGRDYARASLKDIPIKVIAPADTETTVEVSK